MGIELTRWGSLPPFYAVPQILNADDHRHLGLLAQTDYRFAAVSTGIPIGLSEVAEASRYYPIVFALGPNPVPVIATGLIDGRNLFVEADGSWSSGPYLPGYLRQYPFIVGPVDESGQAPMVIDRGAKELVDLRVSGAEPLFDHEDKPTARADAATRLCLEVYQQTAATLDFAHAAGQAGIVMAGKASITLPNGVVQTVTGFGVVDEAALNRLPDAVIATWFRTGWLDILALQRASQHNWTSLAERYLDRRSLGLN